MNIKHYVTMGLAVVLASCQGKPVNEPMRIPPVFNLVVYRLDDETGNDRGFIDDVPFGSLDRVFIFKGREKTEIKRGDPKFDEQERVYLERIRPLYIQ